MRVAALQTDITWHDRPTNFNHVHMMAQKAVNDGAELIVLPEMFATGFSMDTTLTAESIDGPTPVFLRTLAMKHNVAVIAGFALATPGHLPHNVALTVDKNGNDIGCYAKVNLISLLSETRYFAPGTGAEPATINGIRIAPLICYDLRFPELFLTVAPDVAMFVVIASWPATRQHHWDTLVRARAIENQVYVVGVNRVGSGGGLHFSGGSVIVDPLGNICCHAGDAASTIVADIDPAMVTRVRSEMPFLNDRLSAQQLKNRPAFRNSQLEIRNS
jgi:omega-amidase